MGSLGVVPGGRPSAMSLRISCDAAPVGATAAHRAITFRPVRGGVTRQKPSDPMRREGTLTHQAAARRSQPHGPSARHTEPPESPRALRRQRQSSASGPSRGRVLVRRRWTMRRVPGTFFPPRVTVTFSSRPIDRCRYCRITCCCDAGVARAQPPDWPASRLIRLVPKRQKSQL
jgi:hypothetical protein